MADADERLVCLHLCRLEPLAPRAAAAPELERRRS